MFTSGHMDVPVSPSHLPVSGVLKLKTIIFANFSLFPVINVENCRGWHRFVIIHPEKSEGRYLCVPGIFY